ncbi:MAG: tetratricopeptide repeat protein [Sandaracinus sp.]
MASTLVLAPAAHAQRGGTETPTASPEATEQARQLFERGLASLSAERWEEARGLFEQAWELTPRPSILVNLGTAQRQSGQLVEARDSYRTFLERYPTHELAARTRTSLAEVEALIPHMTIQVEGLRDGDEVFLDETPVPALATRFEANPGLRQVSLWRGGRMIQSVRVRVELEGDEEVFLHASELAPSEVAASATESDPSSVPPASPPPEAHGDDTGLVVGLVIGAIVLVGAAVTVGVVLGTQDSPRPVLDPTIRAGVITFQ